MENTNKKASAPEIKPPKLSKYLQRIEQLDEREQIWLDGFLTGAVREAAAKKQKEGA